MNEQILITTYKHLFYYGAKFISSILFSISSNNSTSVKNNDRDIVLLKQINNGNKQALTELYSHYAAHLMAILFKITNNKQEAEDLVHDVFIEAWQKSGSYNPKRGSVRNWLFLRGRSRAIDRIRKLAKSNSHSIDETEQPAPIDKQATHTPEQLLEHHQAKKALDLLPPEHALLVRASYFDDLSYREIAKKYAIPEGTVKSRMLTAFKLLRKQLAQPKGAFNHE